MLSARLAISNESEPKATQDRPHQFSWVLPLGLLILVGAFIGYILLSGGQVNRSVLSGLILFGPLVLILGIVVVVQLIRHVACRARSLCIRAILLHAGLAALALGACPWLYTPLFTGARPGTEASGMLGTAIFLCVGLPGLVLTGLALTLYLASAVGRLVGELMPWRVCRMGLSC